MEKKPQKNYPEKQKKTHSTFKSVLQHHISPNQNIWVRCAKSSKNLSKKKIENFSSFKISNTSKELIPIDLLLTQNHLYKKLPQINKSDKNIYTERINISFALLKYKKKKLKEPESGEEITQSFIRSQNFQYIVNLRIHDQKVSLHSYDKEEVQSFIKKIRSFCILQDFHSVYKPIKLLGSGAFSRVYLLQRKQDKEKYAVKTFQKKKLKDQDRGFEILKKEIEIMREVTLARIPGACRLIEVHETPQSVYIIIEYLKGDELYYKRKRKMLKTSEVMNIAKSLLTTLEGLESLSIIHRDLKPDNIIMKKSKNDQGDKIYEPVIIDFGFACREDDEDYIYYKCGTPGYVAPEIITRTEEENMDEPTTCAGDIFSLGLIILWLLTGKHPFIPNMDIDTIFRLNRKCCIKFDEIPEMKKYDSLTINLVKDMLEIDPKKRISAKEALESFALVEEVEDMGDLNEFDEEDAEAKLIDKKYTLTPMMKMRQLNSPGTEASAISYRSKHKFLNKNWRLTENYLPETANFKNDSNYSIKDHLNNSNSTLRFNSQDMDILSLNFKNTMETPGDRSQKRKKSNFSLESDFLPINANKSRKTQKRKSFFAQEYKESPMFIASLKNKTIKQVDFEFLPKKNK